MDAGVFLTTCRLGVAQLDLTNCVLRSLSNPPFSNEEDLGQTHLCAKSLPLITVYNPMDCSLPVQDLRDIGLILGSEDPLEEGMVTYSTILAWSIPGLEEPGGLQSIGL